MAKLLKKLNISFFLIAAIILIGCTKTEIIETKQIDDGIQLQLEKKSGGERNQFYCVGIFHGKRTFRKKLKFKVDDFNEYSNQLCARFLDLKAKNSGFEQIIELKFQYAQNNEPETAMFLVAFDSNGKFNSLTDSLYGDWIF